MSPRLDKLLCELVTTLTTVLEGLILYTVIRLVFAIWSL